MRVAILLLAALLAGCASESTAPAAEVTDDSDGDGYPDAVETRMGSDPHDEKSIPIREEPLSFSDAVTILAGTEVPDGDCGAQGTIDMATVTWAIEAPSNATSAFVQDIVVRASLPPTMAELDLYVYSPDDELLTEPSTMTVPPSDTDSVTLDGQHAVGDYRIEVRGCLGSGEVSIEANGTLYYAPDVDTLLHEQGVEHHH